MCTCASIHLACTHTCTYTLPGWLWSGKGRKELLVPRAGLMKEHQDATHSWIAAGTSTSPRRNSPKKNVLILRVMGRPKSFWFLGLWAFVQRKQGLLKPCSGYSLFPAHISRSVSLGCRGLTAAHFQRNSLGTVTASGPRLLSHTQRGQGPSLTRTKAQATSLTVGPTPWCNSHSPASPGIRQKLDPSQESAWLYPSPAFLASLTPFLPTGPTIDHFHKTPHLRLCLRNPSS